MRAFISYSHRDADTLQRLHVHLAGLRRQRLLVQWYDREILAGDVLDDEISKELEAADVVLLLVSPDFIASDYCVEREMARALERHEAGLARVIPIIIQPCDWQSMSELRRLKALPRDGKPISEWTNSNNAYVDIVEELRRILTKPKQSESSRNQPETVSESATSVKYRIQREFDDIDKSKFRDSAFEIARGYFSNAALELDSVEGLKARFVDNGAVCFGCTIINTHQNHGTANITVHRGGAGSMMGDLFWSFEENSSPNSANGWVNVSSNEYEMFLDGLGSFYEPEMKYQSPEKFAEWLWTKLIEQAGITHA